MCGIAGVLCLDGHAANEERLAAMIARIRHRGPDGAGIFIDRSVGLAHARLSLLDLVNGRQPMQTADGNLTITFNGEIFNHNELRKTLKSCGYSFRTRSDTEVILHAYAEYGEACVDHFNGQWSFAIWDARRRCLFLSRDRFGIRPLFFSQVAGQFLFASEIKALLAHPQVRRELDPVGMSQLFTLWTAVAPRTVFRGIQELPPGHNMVVKDGRIQTKEYWQLDLSSDHDWASTRQYEEELYWLLQDATRLRLQADVPVGAYLSGGLDSSITTALAQREIGSSLCTFSVTFDEREFDESHYQQLVVDRLGIEHHVIHCTATDLARVFPDVIAHAETPVLRTAPAPLFLLSKRVRQEGLKAIVTGEGADEMLGGYDLFKEAKIRRFCANRPRSELRGALFDRLYPYLPKLQSQSNALRQAFFKTSPAALVDPLFSHLPRWNMTARIGRFFSPDFVQPGSSRQAIESIAESLPRDFGKWHHFSQAQYLESAILMPGYILSSQGDRMAMAHSVEGRFPFLDHRLAELVGRLPSRLKMNGTNEKFLLKKTFAQLIPEEIVNRKKQPYRAPDTQSFFRDDWQTAREDYVDELLSPNRLRDDGVFDPEAVACLLRKVHCGKATGTRDNMAFVGILSTQLLVDRFLRDVPSEQPNVATICRTGLQPVGDTICRTGLQPVGDTICRTGL